MKKLIILAIFVSSAIVVFAQYNTGTGGSYQSVHNPFSRLSQENNQTMSWEYYGTCRAYTISNLGSTETINYITSFPVYYREVGNKLILRVKFNGQLYRVESVPTDRNSASNRFDFRVYIYSMWYYFNLE